MAADKSPSNPKSYSDLAYYPIPLQAISVSSWICIFIGIIFSLAVVSYMAIAINLIILAYQLYFLGYLTNARHVYKKEVKLLLLSFLIPVSIIVGMYFQYGDSGHFWSTFSQNFAGVNGVQQLWPVLAVGLCISIGNIFYLYNPYDDTYKNLGKIGASFLKIFIGVVAFFMFLGSAVISETTE